MRRMMRANAITEHTTMAAISPGCKPATQRKIQQRFILRLTYFIFQSSVLRNQPYLYPRISSKYQNIRYQLIVSWEPSRPRITNLPDSTHPTAAAPSIPSPAYPVMHEHVKEPGVFVHTPNTSLQSSVPSVHSSLSVVERKVYLINI